MPLQYPAEWKFEDGCSCIPEDVVEELFKAAVKTSTGSPDPQQILEIFKSSFAAMEGNESWRSSSLSWARNDLWEMLTNAASNAATFLDSYWSAFEVLTQMDVVTPNERLINSVLANHNVGFEILPPRLVRVGRTDAKTAMAPVTQTNPWQQLPPKNLVRGPAEIAVVERGQQRVAASGGIPWSGIEFEGRFFAWDGPFHDLKEADPRLPRLEFQQGLADAIQEVGHVPSYTSDPVGLAAVRETDRKTWFRRILGGPRGVRQAMVVDAEHESVPSNVESQTIGPPEAAQTLGTSQVTINIANQRVGDSYVFNGSAAGVGPNHNGHSIVQNIEQACTILPVGKEQPVIASITPESHRAGPMMIPDFVVQARGNGGFGDATKDGGVEANFWVRNDGLSRLKVTGIVGTWTLTEEIVAWAEADGRIIGQLSSKAASPQDSVEIAAAFPVTIPVGEEREFKAHVRADAVRLFARQVGIRVEPLNWSRKWVRISVAVTGKGPKPNQMVDVVEASSGRPSLSAESLGLSGD